MTHQAIFKVAERLGEFLDDVVVVGGCAGLLLMPPGDLEFRPTDDIDLVVPITTYPDLSEFEAKLRALGWTNSRDEGAPICRWQVEGVDVDLMPVERAVLGFGNRWYQEALKDPVAVGLGRGISIKVVNLPVFLATKFEAHADRGRGVYLGDSDIEDVVLLLAYRADSYELILQAPEAVRCFLQAEAIKLLQLRNVKDIVSGCFAPNQQAFARDALRVIEGLGQ